MKKPFEIVILSGKGGTGKTSVTAAFASLAKHAVFTDCDVDAADLHLVLSPDIYQQEEFSSGAKAVVDTDKCTSCGLCKDVCRFSALAYSGDIPVIDEYACEGCGLCSIVCPVDAITIENYNNNHIYFATCRFGPMVYGKLGIAEENSGKLVSKIRQYARELAQKHHAEIIITDGPPGIGCPVISAVTGSDLVLAVTEPTMSGWHDLDRLIEMIGGFKTPVFVVINKYDLNEEMTRVIEGNLLAKNIRVIGKIPYSDTMVLALLEAKTINEFDPSGYIAGELTRIWETITLTYEQNK
ncbi:MAG: 4Fe-4S binding protein [Bacteroidales bacterium]|nr:4Fe-4S binding protein [Bacteroidales bacterium]